MVIDRLFFSYRRPSRYCLIGSGGVDCFQEQRGGARRIHAVQTRGLMKMDEDEGRRLGAVLGNRSWGAVLRSDSFIFNIFDFDHLPVSSARRRELAQWRLQKVFPEDISRFIHRVFHLGGKRLLSVLLPRADAQRVEDWFREHRVPLIFMGNSTVELMNRLWGGILKSPGASTPRVLVELDNQLGVAVFQESNRPYFMRKFRCDSEEGFEGEMKKTLAYVKGNYGRSPGSVAFVPGRPAFDLVDPERIWRELDLRPINVPAVGVFAFTGDQ